MKLTVPLEPAHNRMNNCPNIYKAYYIGLTVLYEGGATQETVYLYSSWPVCEKFSVDCANTQLWTVASEGQVEFCDC